MKLLPQDALDALATGAPLRVGAVHLDLAAGPLRIFGGDGALDVPELGLFTGVRALNLTPTVTAEVGVGVSGVKLSLSPLEPALASQLAATPTAGRDFALYVLLFSAQARGLLGWLRVLTGRCGALEEISTVGGTTALNLPLDGSSLDLGRRGGRTRSDADQRVLGGPDDASLAATAGVGEKTLSWGALPPAAVARAAPGATPDAGAWARGFRIF